MAILQTRLETRSPFGELARAGVYELAEARDETAKQNPWKKVVQSEREIRGKGRRPHRSCHFAKRWLLSPRQVCARSPLFSLFASARILSPLRKYSAEFRL